MVAHRVVIGDGEEVEFQGAGFGDQLVERPLGVAVHGVGLEITAEPETPL